MLYWSNAYCIGQILIALIKCLLHWSNAYCTCQLYRYLSLLWPTNESCHSPRATGMFVKNMRDKQRVLMHGHQGWNVRHGLCHIYMRYVYIYIWVVDSLCFFCCLFITVIWWYVWCIEWASGKQEEVQACLVTLWLFIISCYSLYKTTLVCYVMIWK